MKKINILLFAGILASFYGISQPVLTGSNTNPVVGDSHQMAREQNVPFTFATPGSNQTWNYANLTTSSTMGVNAVSAAGGLVPTASVKVDYVGGASIYYNTNSTEMAQIAVSGAGVDMMYSNPEINMKYPFQMGSSNTDSWKATFISGGTPFIRTGTTSITGVGYGTLTLPNGTYPNVLCVSYIQNYDDSTSGMQFVTYTMEAQLFYKPGNHQPILSLSNLSSTMMGNTTTVPSYFYMSSGIVSDVDDFTQEASLDVYPNPSQGSFTVSFTEKNKYSNVSFALTDMLGKRVDITSRQTGDVYHIASTSLNSGVYRLAVYADAKKIADKAVMIKQD